MRGGKLRRSAVLVGMGLGALSVASMAFAAVTGPSLVVGGRGNQIIPSATPGAAFVAFAASRPGHPNQYDAYLRPAGMPRIKINGKGEAFPGGFSGSTLIYQHVRNGQSDLAEIDTGTLVHSLPAGVNTRAWEWGPTISGDWILFGRIGRRNPPARRIVLHNETTTQTRVLAIYKGRPPVVLFPGQVNGDWATWDRFIPNGGDDSVFRYRISTRQTVQLPTPLRSAQGPASVDSVGDVFYVRHRRGTCGVRTSIHEHTIAGSDVRLISIPAGSAVGSIYAVDEGGGTVTVYYDQGHCTGRANWNIYKIVIT
jgi:hypothetical protein